MPTLNDADGDDGDDGDDEDDEYKEDDWGGISVCWSLIIMFPRIE